jgi:hypothetical protein
MYQVCINYVSLSKLGILNSLAKVIFSALIEFTIRLDSTIQPFKENIIMINLSFPTLSKQV